MIKKSVAILGLAALFAAPTPGSFPTLVGSAEALSLSQRPNVQRWCGPGGRLCYDPATTRWTWKKRRR